MLGMFPRKPNPITPHSLHNIWVGKLEPTFTHLCCSFHTSLHSKVFPRTLWEFRQLLECYFLNDSSFWLRISRMNINGSYSCVGKINFSLSVVEYRKGVPACQIFNYIFVVTFLIFPMNNVAHKRNGTFQNVTVFKTRYDH